MERIVIRPARASDAADLARNWIEVAQHYVELDPEAFRGSIDRRTDRVLRGVAQAATIRRLGVARGRGGQVVGDISARLERPAEDAERQLLRYPAEIRIYVDALGVVQARRRRGVGTRLMGAIERWARERGAVCVMLDTYAASPSSVPFYERGMGYQRRSIVFEKAVLHLFQVNRSASTKRTRWLPTRAAAMASISGDASTAVTSLAWRSSWPVHTPGPQASSSTLPVG
jgi:GNAT superfamily N-acetyltransferase